MAAAGNLIPQPNAQAPALVGTTITLATFAKSWINYLTRMDQMFRNAQYGPLTAATSDKQAASLNVPVGGFYQNAGVVHVRLS